MEIPSLVPRARNLPSGLNATLRDLVGILRSSVSESPVGVSRSQSLTVLSQLPEARVRLSGAKATQSTFPPCRRVKRGLSVPEVNPPGSARTAQTRTVPSQLADASHRPSAL